MKRLVMALMASVFLMSVVFVLPACAETVFRDGIEVTLMTDKESYDSMDAINARLAITNTNRYAVQNVSSELTAPDGYVLRGDAEEEHGTLRAGQRQTQEAAVYRADYVPNVPKTGDNSHGMLWGLLFVLSSVVLCAVVIHNPHAKRFFSLLLCLVMISTMVLEAAPVVAEPAHESEIIVVSKTVLVNGKEVLLTGTVAYEADVKTTQKAAGPTISGEKINDTAEYVKVREGDKLSFTGKIKASEGAVISTVQVFVYDAKTEVPYSIGEKYYIATGVNADEFDLSTIPEMTIGEVFGQSDYALTEGKRYSVMFYATDSNGNGFADMDAQAAGNQGPVIAVRVLLPVGKCDHSAKEYTYVRDEYTASRITDNRDGQTHLVENSYKRYCADCGAYLMNIWGSAASQDHNMEDGVCKGCGYSAVPILFAARSGLEKISFESYALGVLAGKTYYISWDENGGSDTYIVNVKLLDGEPAYHDEEAGTSIVLNSKSSSNDVWFTVPETAKNGQYVKVHVYGESNGIQTEAGNQLYLRVGCEHDKSVAETVKKYYPIEGNETNHRYIEHYTHKCLVCGFVLEKRESDPVIGEHEFNSMGRCSLCRYEKELDCYHTYSNRTLLRSYHQQNNDSQHYLVNAYRVNCRDCGELIYSNMPEYQLQNHEFNAAGECVQCNWNKDSECQHNNQECTQFGKVNYSCDTPVGGELIFYHWIEQECVLICADCGKVLDENWTTSDVEPHEFDSKKTCQKCGYVDENLIEDDTAPQILSFTSNVGTTVKIGEMPTYRAVVYDENLRYAELSTDDGWTLDMVTNPVSSTADLSAWSFAGEVGTYTFRVTAVDYAGNSTVQNLTISVVAEDTECRHTTYTDYENGKIQYTDNNDGKTHIWQSGYNRICNTCHENMGVVYGKENTADHDYTNGDVCPCGYNRSNCQHTPSEIKTYNRHLFKALNEKQHQTTAIVWDMVCSTCGKTYEEIDTVGDENNPIGLPYDHVWKDGKCMAEGCGYECLHPEKKADGSDNYQDKYLGTVSLTDNGDGVTHHHVYNVKRTCLLCEHSWTMTIDDPAEKHTIRYLDQEGDNAIKYDHDSEKHWQVVPEGCSCGYRTGKTEIRNKEEHKPQVTSTDYRYDPDGNVHQVWRIQTIACDCGMSYEPEIEYLGPSGHMYTEEGNRCKCGLYQEGYSDRFDYYHGYVLDEEDEFTFVADETTYTNLKQYLMSIDIDETRAQEIVNYVKSAPQPYRDIYLMSYEIYRFRYMDKEDTERAHYSPSDNTLYLKDEGWLFTTFFHESGHAIDANLGAIYQEQRGYMSSDTSYATCLTRNNGGEIEIFTESEDIDEDDWGSWNDIYVCLRSDIYNYLRDYVYATIPDRVFSGRIALYLMGEISDATEIEKQIANTVAGKLGYNNESMTDEKELLLKLEAMQIVLNKGLGELYGFNQKLLVEKMGIADVFGAMTENRIGMVYSYHDTEYWEQLPGKRMAVLELWAEYFGAQMMKNDKAIRDFREVFPTACEYLDEMAELMHETLERDYAARNGY